MPSKLRRQLIDQGKVGAYHCYSRCVRGKYLCGRDRESGKDRSYRKGWIRRRLEALASVFAIDLLDHAVLDNHVHTILRNRPDIAKKLSEEEVLTRWSRVSRMSLELQPEMSQEDVDALKTNEEWVSELRARLSNPSWFMIMLKEPIARRANEEDKVSGHFWAERFYSEPLENDEALLACSLYVDLNPIRAGMARSPEDSVYTGAHDRLRDLQGERIARGELRQEALLQLFGIRGDSPRYDLERLLHKPRSGWLSPLRVEGDGYEGAKAKRRASDLGYLPMSVEKYLEFLDACGREEVEGKRGVIPATLPPVLERLQLDPLAWGEEVTKAAKRFARIATKCASESFRRGAH